MVKLEPKDYTKVLQLLPQEGMNTLFAEIILTGRRKGQVFADHRENPTWFYIRHPGLMTLLVGDPANVGNEDELRDFLLNTESIRKENEWMQVYPSSWNTLLEKLLGKELLDKGPDEQYRKPLPAEENRRVIRYRRSDFAFRRDRFEDSRLRYQSGHRTAVTDRTTYQSLEKGVIPQIYWDSYEDFMNFGMGFTAYSPDENPASTAFAAFVIGNELEIGIETQEAYRGQGYAQSVCSRLIEYCLEKGYEPVWGCHSGNIGSGNLARKLGFEEVISRPYYRLPV